ncbi:MAG TPA: hypothetical protein VMH24_06690 [Candidatus Sulfotelmatobacter sp.]|nr:hypothetical protein [Candidatus Sulfotelmatobacter sp.]
MTHQTYPISNHPSTPHPEVPDVFRHPIVDDVGFTERTRRREATEHRLASASRRAATTPTPQLRRRLGSLLVRAGYSLGAPRPTA